MAKAFVNDMLKGITGKVCGHSDQYYSMNTSSGIVHTGKRCNPYTGPASAKQQAQYVKFKAQAAVATTWLNANKPDPEDKDDKGTALYQQAQKLKKELQLSNVRQVLYKYMNKETLTITLPAAGTSTSGGTSSGGSTSGGSTQGGGTQGGGSGNLQDGE